MSLPRIYTSRQFQEENLIPECPRCKEQEDMYIQLGCHHQFCIVCITFIYLKFRGVLSNKNQIKCLQCQTVSELDQQLSELISQVINKELGPIVKNQEQNNESQMSINHTNLECSQRVIVSKPNQKYDDDSLNQNAGLKSSQRVHDYNSKSDSPQNSEANIEDFCPVHPVEEISYICMTCNLKPLCYKCIKPNKHINHDVKIVKKAIQALNQRFSFLHLQTAQKIENMQLYQKRLCDRKKIFEERVEKSIKQIKAVFYSLQKKILQKSNEIVEAYRKFYQSAIAEVQTKAQKSEEILKNMKQFQLMVNNFVILHEQNICNKSIQTKPWKVVQKYEELQNQRKLLFSPNLDNNKINNTNAQLFKLHQTILDPIQYQNFNFIQKITQITESIQKITLPNYVLENKINQKLHQINPSPIIKSEILFNKNKTLALRNCSSRQKLRQNHLFLAQQQDQKRIKTNVPVSLNTSRDKRQKKYTTKTQEDERRLKSKANYRTQTNTQSKNLNRNTQKPDKYHDSNEATVPNYITKHLQRHQNTINGPRKVSPFTNGTIYLMQNIHNSKNNSKIVSKNSNILNNDDLNNRKKNKEIIQIETNKEKKKTIKTSKLNEIIKKKR